MKLFSKLEVLLCGAVLIVSGCATANPALWPPTPGVPTKEIYVSLDTWHAMIGFKAADVRAQGNSRKNPHANPTVSPPNMFEEWGYAEKQWYLEGQQGFTGVLRALFWPSDGIVEIAEHDQLWADRTPQPPSDLFRFDLSEEGYQRLRSHLQSTRASPDPVKTFARSRFYRATHVYHVFHHCHHYVTSALQKAGLPLSRFWSLTRTGLARQLRRVLEATKKPEEK